MGLLFDKKCKQINSHAFIFTSKFEYVLVWNPRRISTKFHFILYRIILTLVASAFTPSTNRTSESASVYNGMCEVEKSWFTFCSC